MRRGCLLLCVLCLLLSLASAAAEVGDMSADDGGALIEGCVVNGSRQVRFLYPEQCAVEDEGIGFIVRLNETEYISLMVPRGSMNGVEAVHDMIGGQGGVLDLSEDICVFAVHGDDNHRMPGLDILEVGLNLPDGNGVVLCAFGEYGGTEVYGLLLTAAHSIMDTKPLDDWLSDTWLPYIRLPE